MTHNASKISSEKPLLGAVLCCTSIAPEERTRIADYAEQMGAEHKLDLTSDVTHLLVGSTNTPKYQYVAREREDVKVLRPDWVDAVRECWMEDRVLDLNALEAEYRIPTLAGLKICITGFDDLNLRARLQKSVIANGGEYTGDLTKDVTHLIAAQPQGKKYEYATLWQKKVVSLQWYQETLNRGMQLDESTYHPSRPASEQGKGAWNKQDTTQAKSGKRSKDEPPAQEPARKLRRTASAKLTSQTDNMWDDIVGHAAPQLSANGDVLRPAKSMPLLREDSQSSRSLNTGQGLQVNNSTTRDGFLSGKFFVVTNFDKKKEALIDQTLRGAGAVVIDTITDLITNENIVVENMYLIVPHQTRHGELPYFGKSPIKPTIVTELWLERCILAKSFISVVQYPLGGLVTENTSPEIESFEVNATGFQSIETLHIAKTVALTGAKYREVFTPTSKLLVCNSKNINRQKLFHAKEWGVPAVSERWLCEFLTSGQIPPFGSFPIAGHEDESVDLETALKQKRLAQSKSNRQSVHTDESAIAALQGSRSLKDQMRRTSSVDSNMEHAQLQNNNSGTRAASTSNTNPVLTETALREISPNSPTKRFGHPQSQVKKALFKTYDGAAILQENRNAESQQSGSNVSQSKVSPSKMAHDATSINSAIQDLLNMKARAKTEAIQRQGEPKENRKKLLGRALSNLSNASHGSIHSRASSVDSLNTDGIGSEIGPPSARSNNADTPTASAAAPHRINHLSGRALQNRSTSSAIPPSNDTDPTAAAVAAVPVTIDPFDPLLLRDEFAAVDEGPQLTQLGYEDSEEAVALREKLAEKRRARSRLGQDESDPKPAVARGADREREKEVTKQQQQKPPQGQKKVIRDDDTLNASGWGGGRRTRGAKNRSRDLEGEEWIMN